MKKAIMTISGLGVNILIYIAVILIIYRAGAMAYDFSYQVFGSPVVSEYATDTVNVVIESGDGISTVASDLEDKGLIENRLAFILKARLAEATFMPGTYPLSQNMSSDDMIEMMSDAANSVAVQPLESAETSEGEGQGGEEAAEGEE